MRIIQIIDVRWYNACADFAIQQARGLARLDHQVLLMANPGAPPARVASEAGLNVSQDIDFAGFNIFRSAQRLKRISQEFGADIIFAHRGESHLIASLASKDTGHPVVRFRGDVRSPRSGFFSRILNERMTAGIAISTRRLKEEYERRFRLDGIPLRVLYPGIDSSNFKSDEEKEESRSRFGLDRRRPVVGLVGRLSPVKGHRYFIEAARFVQERNSDVQFVIAGEKAQIRPAELEKYAAGLGLSGLRMPGQIENIGELMAALDIGVIASVGSEMICRVMMEYFASGVAVVGTRINQVEELGEISGAAVLVPPGNSRAMGEEILKLIENKAERERLAESGRRWVSENRSLERLGQETAEFLEQVINGQAVDHTC